MRWDPEQYLRLADERGRAYHELLARVGATDPGAVVDLGCGPGNLTVTLARRWPRARVRGIDSSPDMIATARSTHESPETPGLEFAVGDIAGFDPPPGTEVLVSNAALHWVPGHDERIRHWAATLPVGGWIAFQVPGNFGAPSHRLMRGLAESDSWSRRVDPAALAIHREVLEPVDYAHLMLDCGWQPDVWETTYLHLLPGPDPVLDWVRGTGLRPILAALDPDDARKFEDEYVALLRRAYPARAGGTLFAFRRIFCVAHQESG